MKPRTVAVSPSGRRIDRDDKGLWLGQYPDHGVLVAPTGVREVQYRDWMEHEDVDLMREAGLIVLGSTLPWRWGEE